MWSPSSPFVAWLESDLETQLLVLHLHILFDLDGRSILCSQGLFESYWMESQSYLRFHLRFGAAGAAGVGVPDALFD